MMWLIRCSRSCDGVVRTAPAVCLLHHLLVEVVQHIQSWGVVSADCTADGFCLVGGYGTDVLAGFGGFWRARELGMQCGRFRGLLADGRRFVKERGESYWVAHGRVAVWEQLRS